MQTFSSLICFIICECLNFFLKLLSCFRLLIFLSVKIFFPKIYLFKIGVGEKYLPCTLTPQLAATSIPGRARRRQSPVQAEPHAGRARLRAEPRAGRARPRAKEQLSLVSYMDGRAHALGSVSAAFPGPLSRSWIRSRAGRMHILVSQVEAIPTLPQR